MQLFNYFVKSLAEITKILPLFINKPEKGLLNLESGVSSSKDIQVLAQSVS